MSQNMRRWPLMMICGLLLALPAAAASQTASTTKQDRPPNVLNADRSAYAPASAPPLWVPADVAFSDDGELRKDLFEPAFRSILEKNASQNGNGGCHFALGAPTSEEHSSKRTFNDLVSGSLAILEGQVKSSEPGFYNGIPGELLRVAIEDTPKAMAHAPRSGVVRLFLANATIKTARGTICSREPFATLPEVADHVVLFVSVEPNNVGRDILTVETTSQLVVEHGGSLHGPAAILRSIANGHTATDVTAAVRQNSHVNDTPRAPEIR